MRPSARVILASILACLVVACSGKQEQPLQGADASADLARITAARADLDRVWNALDALRDELAALDERPRLTPEETARRSDLDGKVRAAEGQFEAAYSADQSALADFLNQALNTQPQGSATLQALRLYADSAIRNARDFVEHSGDYRRAIELLETARSYYEAVAAGVPDDLTAAIERARDYRFLTRTRFEQLKKGMSIPDVKALVGVPFYANVRHSEVGGKRVASWLYGREDGEVAALYFDDRGTLYAWKWDAKSAQ